MPKTKAEYQQELLSPEWADFRKQVLNKHHLTCQRCFNIRYLPDDCLITKVTEKKPSYGKRIATEWYIGDQKVPAFLDNPLWLSIHSIKKDRVTSRQSILSTTFTSTTEKKPEIQALFRITISQQEKDELTRQLETGTLIPTLYSTTDLRRIAQSEPKRISWDFVRLLNVHHHVYRIGAKAWEYEAKDVTTYCLSCHQDIHSQIKIPVLDQNNRHTSITYTPCSRCGGAGWFPEYKHRDNGICYKCGGARYLELEV